MRGCRWEEDGEGVVGWLDIPIRVDCERSSLNANRSVYHIIVHIRAYARIHCALTRLERDSNRVCICASVWRCVGRGGGGSVAGGGGGNVLCASDAH